MLIQKLQLVPSDFKPANPIRPAPSSLTQTLDVARFKVSGSPKSGPGTVAYLEAQVNGIHTPAPPRADLDNYELNPR